MKTINKDDRISKEELKKMAKNMFGDLVKAVVDVKKEIVVVDAELHADQERELLETGSKQEYLWGINLYPDEKDQSFIEFDSMINLRPSYGNRSRGVDDKNIQKRIIEIVNNLVE